MFLKLGGECLSMINFSSVGSQGDRWNLRISQQFTNLLNQVLSVTDSAQIFGKTAEKSISLKKDLP